MRMRHKKHGEKRIAACAELRLIPTEGQPVHPVSFFPAEKPVALEIGCGKGDFAIGMAKAHPEQNWIAMERVPDVACLALEKAMATRADRPDNLRFLIGNAQNLSLFFLPHSFAEIYLNFSDPWPKSGYAKRRLTHSNFLALYRELLIPGGILKLKTDNVDLFEFSLEEFEKNGLEILRLTRDLHAEDWARDNVMTEYEQRFSELGQPIHSAWVRFPAETNGDEHEN